MFFKGSIYITDPCYISRDEDWMEEKGFDIESYVINLPEFSSYLLEATGSGDGSWKVYEVPSEMELTKEDIYDVIEDVDNSLKDFPVIGKFCADAGMSCVVYKSEAAEYNPEFAEDAQGKMKHCVALIKDFEGDIDSYFDEDDCLHFIGIGNKTFFTA